MKEQKFTQAQLDAAKAAIMECLDECERQWGKELLEAAMFQLLDGDVIQKH